MLDKKIILVTGAARGIGRGSALLFAREGARVAAADISAEGAQATAALICAQGGDATAITVDITSPTAVSAMIARVIQTYGRLDGAFNNAGINGTQAGARGKLTADWTEEEFDRLVAVNLKGTWLCMKAEINQMLAQGGGAIVNTASLAALTGFRTTAGYAASKHGIVGLTKTAAIEYAPHIRVNAICPGWIETDMTAATIAQHGEALLARVPAREFGTPDDIGEVACWLLSDRARFVTGTASPVDGGYMAN
jgi:NAD(P)-dependent dehydrogenase (short-subunit alcohol dehydrogenase family)